LYKQNKISATTRERNSPKSIYAPSNPTTTIPTIQILYKHEQVASIYIIKLRPSINAPARASAQIIIKQIDRTLKAAPAGD
jgi:hypothetical protein